MPYDMLSGANTIGSSHACRPLFLTPKNEAGVRKLVCTTLRPTLLPHTDLYDLAGIVQFVASYFAYEPLANAVHYPEYLPSPSSVISWQVIHKSVWQNQCHHKEFYDDDAALHLHHYRNLTQMFKGDDRAAMVCR